MKSVFSTAEELLAADPERLDQGVLRHLKTYEGGGTIHQPVGGFNRDYYIGAMEGRPLYLGPMPLQAEYGKDQPAVSRRVQEAWHRLVTKGYLMQTPGQPVQDWFVITAEGERQLKECDLYDRWEKYSVQLVKEDLVKGGGKRVLDVGRQGEQQSIAWKWVEMKERQATLSERPAELTSGPTSTTQSSIEGKRSLREDQIETMKSGRIEKTVFVSYRRSAVPWAQLIFQDLTHNGFDVFFDFRGIASGGFEEVILENIRARAHFLVLLTPTALERCRDSNDLFRREIETAIDNQRNIVPVMLDNFDFGAPGIDDQLGGTLAVLKRYNGLPVYAAYIPEAMNRLRTEYLNKPLDLVLHPASPSAVAKVKEDQAAAAKAPPVTETELKASERPRYIFCVKIQYQDDLENIEGTHSEEPYGPTSLIVYDGPTVVARYPDRIEHWSRQPWRNLTSAPAGSEPGTIVGLSNAASELLLEAVRDQNGMIMSMGAMGGRIIQTNNRGFVEEGSPRSEALWMGAIKDLQQLDLIEDRNYKGEAFFVTERGYRVADQLRATS